MKPKEYLAVALFAVFLAIFGVIFADSYLISVMIAIGLLSMTLIGLDLMFGYCGQVDFGHQGFYALGAYTSAILVAKMGLPPLLALLIGVLLSALVALLIGRIVFRLKGYYFILATMVFGLVIYYVAGAFPDWTGGMSGMQVPSLSIDGLLVKREIDYYWVVWAITLVMLIIAMNIVRGRVGRALRAISSSEVAAEAMGIDATKYLVQIYVLGAVFASIAGSLLAHHERFTVPYYFNINTIVIMFVALCLGGKGTVWGSLLGAAIVTALPEFMYMFKTYSTLFYGVVFVLTLTLLPDGLAGVIKAVAARLRRRRTAAAPAH